MFDYLECLMDGLRIVGGDRIRMPERRRFDPESCMFISLPHFPIKEKPTRTIFLRIR